HSSTTIISAMMGLLALCLKYILFFTKPNNLCIVSGVIALSCSLSCLLMLIWVLLRLSAIRAAAFPVGAASTIFVSGLMVSNIDNIFATVVVFPVPGPPVMILKLFSIALMVATNCQSITLELGSNNCLIMA